MSLSRWINSDVFYISPSFKVGHFAPCRGSQSNFDICFPLGNFRNRAFTTTVIYSKDSVTSSMFFFFLSNGDFNIFISLWRIGVGRSTWNGSNWSNFKIFLRPWTCPMALLKLAALFPDRLNYQLNFYPHPIGTFSWLERVSKSAIWRPIARHHREDAGRADAIGRPFKSIVNWMQMAGSMWQMKETGQPIGKATVEDGWTRYEWSCWAVTINAERWAIERAVRMIKRS